MRDAMELAAARRHLAGVQDLSEARAKQQLSAAYRAEIAELRGGQERAVAAQAQARELEETIAANVAEILET